MPEVGKAVNPPGRGGPRAAIVIPSYNGIEFLRECLESLQAQSYPDFSVILVDNASSDGSAAFVRENFPEVRVLENESNTGYAGACNRGLQTAMDQQAEYFILLNSDTRADRDWLRELIEVAESDRSIGLCQSMIYIDGDVPNEINSAGNEVHYLGFAFCGHYREIDLGQFRSGQDIPYASGAALLVKRSVIEEIGPLDGDLFLYHEDLDLCWRARMAGFRIALAPRSRIHHKYSFSRNKSKFYYMERNRLIVAAKSYSSRTLLVLAPALLGAEAAMIAYSLTGGWFRDKLRGYGYLVSHRDSIMKKRRLAQQRRRLPDRELLSYCTSRMTFADMESDSLTRIANPVSAAYWRVARKLL